MNEHNIISRNPKLNTLVCFWWYTHTHTHTHTHIYIYIYIYSTCERSNSLLKFNIVKLVLYVNLKPDMTSLIVVILLTTRSAGDTNSQEIL